MQIQNKRKLVVIESPFAGPNPETIKRNIIYARFCVRDSLLRGEYPIASHLLYTQEGILDDNIPHERALGIEAGLVWGAHADITAVYQDLGMSSGMYKGILRAKSEGRVVDLRHLPSDLKTAFDEKIKNLGLFDLSCSTQH